MLNVHYNRPFGAFINCEDSLLNILFLAPSHFVNVDMANLPNLSKIVHKGRRGSKCPKICPLYAVIWTFDYPPSHSISRLRDL